MTDRDRRIPPDEGIQADPQLRLSSGHASPAQITLVALACLAVLAMMIYGLNRPSSETQRTTATPTQSAPQTTGAGPQDQPNAAQTGGNVAGGGNAPAKSEQAPLNQPSQQPVPEQTKPGVTPDDSKR